MQYTYFSEGASRNAASAGQHIVTKPQKPKLHIMHISLIMIYVSLYGVGQINKKIVIAINVIIALFGLQFYSLKCIVPCK